MKTITEILVALLALEHFGIMYIEMFLWAKPFGLKTFGQTQAQAEVSKVLAANQGLYNGFLGAGLMASLIANLSGGLVFFSTCVLLAGIYGGLTAKRSILYTQALPGLLTLAAVLLAR